MKFSLKRWLRNWINDNEYDNSPSIAVEEANLQSDGMRFQLYKASGGYIVETRNYDRRNDRNDVKLHIITDDKDLGEELGKIITLEALR